MRKIAQSLPAHRSESLWSLMKFLHRAGCRSHRRVQRYQCSSSCLGSCASKPRLPAILYVHCNRSASMVGHFAIMIFLCLSFRNSCLCNFSLDRMQPSDQLCDQSREKGNSIRLHLQRWLCEFSSMLQLFPLIRNANSKINCVIYKVKLRSLTLFLVDLQTEMVV